MDGQFDFPATNISGVSVAGITSNPAPVGASTNASLHLLPANPTCAATDCQYYNGTQVCLQQSRGTFTNPVAETSSAYNDNYWLNRLVTFNPGIRWDQEQLNATTQTYTLNDNWSPSLSINIDLFGDRKSKVFSTGAVHAVVFPGWRLSRSV